MNLSILTAIPGRLWARVITVGAAVSWTRKAVADDNGYYAPCRNFMKF